MEIRKKSMKPEKERAGPDILAPSHLKLGVMLEFWGTLILLCWIYRDRITVEGIVNFVPANTTVTICIMLVLFALKGVTVVVYGGILYAASGILFSLPVAICVNLAGTILMTSEPFFIGEKAGVDLLDQLVWKNKRLDLLRNAPKQNEFLFSFVVRMIGLLPGDLVGMYSGACGFTYFYYICGTVGGMFPSIITFSVMVMSVHDVSSPVFLFSVGCEVILMLLSLSVYLLWRNEKHKEKKRNVRVESSKYSGHS